MESTILYDGMTLYPFNYMDEIYYSEINTSSHDFINNYMAYSPKVSLLLDKYIEYHTEKLRNDFYNSAEYKPKGMTMYFKAPEFVLTRSIKNKVENLAYEDLFKILESDLSFSNHIIKQVKKQDLFLASKENLKSLIELNQEIKERNNIG